MIIFIRQLSSKTELTDNTDCHIFEHLNWAKIKSFYKGNRGKSKVIMHDFFVYLKKTNYGHVDLCWISGEFRVKSLREVQKYAWANRIKLEYFFKTGRWTLRHTTEFKKKKKSTSDAWDLHMQSVAYFYTLSAWIKKKKDRIVLFYLQSQALSLLKQKKFQTSKSDTYVYVKPLLETPFYCRGKQPQRLWCFFIKKIIYTHTRPDTHLEERKLTLNICTLSSLLLKPANLAARYPVICNISSETLTKGCGRTTKH